MEYTDTVTGVSSSHLYVDSDLQVQLHHASMLEVRAKMGGHFIYAKYRAVHEALEVCGQL